MSPRTGRRQLGGSDENQSESTHGPPAEPGPNWDAPARVNPRFEGPVGGTEEFLGRERELAVGVLVTACRLTPR